MELLWRDPDYLLLFIYRHFALSSYTSIILFYQGMVSVSKIFSIEINLAFLVVSHTCLNVVFLFNVIDTTTIRIDWQSTRLQPRWDELWFTLSKLYFLKVIMSLFNSHFNLYYPNRKHFFAVNFCLYTYICDVVILNLLHLHLIKIICKKYTVMKTNDDSIKWISAYLKLP